MMGKNRFFLLGSSAVVILFLLTGFLMGRVLALEGNFYTYLKLFNEALHLIENNYVEEVGPDHLLQGAYRGLFDSLDPVSEYLSPREYQESLRKDPYPAGGVGLTLSRAKGYLGVVAVHPGSPAADRGLRTGDQVLRIQDISTRGMSSVAAEARLRGEPGTEVRLSVMRASWAEAREVRLTRWVPPSPLTTRVLPHAVGYLRLLDLPEDAASRVERALEEFRGSGVRQVILDLRDNASLNLPAAVDVALLFLEPGPVGWLEGRGEFRSPLAEQVGEPVWPEPVLALVNRGTASGAELIAAALQGSRRSILMGTRTFGLGTRHEVFPLPDGAAVRLSTEKLISPDGRGWHGAGLVPDRAVDTEAGDETLLEQASAFLRRQSGEEGLQEAA